MPVQPPLNQENKFFSQLNETNRDQNIISPINDMKHEHHSSLSGEEKKENKLDNDRLKNFKMKTVLEMQKLAQRCQLGLCALSLLQFYRTGDYQEFLIVSMPLTCFFERSFLSLNKFLLLARGTDVRVEMKTHTPPRYSFLTNIGNKLVINPISAVVTTFLCKSNGVRSHH